MSPTGVMHYRTGEHTVACRSGGYQLRATYRPRLVTCQRCKKTPEYREMTEEDPL